MSHGELAAGLGPAATAGALRRSLRVHTSKAGGLPASGESSPGPCSARLFSSARQANQTGEKTAQNFRLEVTNPGGHSSLPVKDNAIYHLAGALKKIEAYTFPAQFTDANRAYFSGMAKIQAARGDAATARAMEALVRDPADEQAIALVSAKDPSWNSTMRTTCVATMLDAGHATNALPQRARANINCRIFPGVAPEAVRSKLEELVADPAVHVTTLENRGPSSRPPP